MTLGAWVTADRIVDLVIGFAVLEGPVLAVISRLWRHPLPLQDIATMLLPGVLLLMALRLSLGHASRWSLALCLALALIAHLVDLQRRWRG